MSGEVSYKAWVALVVAGMAVATLAVLAVGARSAHAAFPGSNGAMAFERDDRIYRMSPDGFGQTQFANAGVGMDPTWSSDGKKIAFAYFDIYWMNCDGTGTPTDLTKDPAIDSQPSFFPDYHKIAFSSDRGGGGMHIYVMTVDNNGNLIGLTQMTTSPYNDDTPAVSPDGKKIAFTRQVNGNYDIYVMNANSPESPTNKPVRLTKSSALDEAPDWSPSGTQIAFMSNRSSNQYDIFVMKPVPESSTNRPKNLTNNPAYDANPTFSPDGKKIAFESSRDGVINIFKMHADGTRQTDITNSTSTFYHAPSWQPDP